MKLSYKILLAIASTFVGLIAVLLIISQTVLLGSFKKLEEDDARRNVERALSALSTDIKSLSDLNLDWASWDETYRFIADRNSVYIKSTLNDETVLKQRLNVIIYLDGAARVVYQKGFDYAAMRKAPVPEGLAAHISPESLLIRHGSVESRREGIIVLKEGFLLSTSHPILTSEGKGPLRGTLIMGRFLDDDEVRRLGEITHMRLALMPYDPHLGPFRSDNGRDNGSILIVPSSVERLNGYALLRDIYGSPALVLKVELPRDIYSQGRRSVFYFVLYLLLAAMASVLAAMLLLEKSVLEKVKRLGSFMSGIGSTGDLSGRFKVSGNDELTRLSEEVNNMLGAIDEMEAGRRSAEDRLRRANDELEARVRERTADLTEANIALKEEISERKRMEDKIRDMVYQDSLTGLPNRLLFIDRLNQVIARGVWHKKNLAAVLFMDIDHFKVINDTLGHSAGDELIKAVARLMEKALREGDTVARMGGDEFTILLQDVAKVEDVPLVIEKVFSSLKDPVQLMGHTVFVTMSIGVSVYPHDGTDSSTLLKNADIAMYNAKGKGGNTYQLYNPLMAEKALARLTIGNKLRTALDNKEFILHYQPQIDLRTGKVSGSEALIRWLDPEEGLLPPSSFIPTAEETGIIVPIGEWGLLAACAFNKKMQEAGFPDLCMSVNISPRMFMQGDIVKTVTGALKETGLRPEFLNLEVTEGIIMADIAASMAIMRELKGIGVVFSIDDFGTGYSSLGYLKSLPVAQLKIDRSFVQDIPHNADDKLIVTAIVRLAQSMNLEVLAEGVETEEQLFFLKSLNCDKIQGFLFSRPLAEDAFMDFLKCRHVF